MGNLFWFPYEETSGGHKIKEIMAHLLDTVVGPDGGRKGRKKIFFKNERTLTDSMCEFYTREDYHSFQEQILTWRDEFVNNLNKKKKKLISPGRIFPANIRKIVVISVLKKPMN